MIRAVDGYDVGDIVIALRGEKVVGAGRISDRYFFRMYAGRDSYIAKRWVMMNITPAPTPLLLSKKQRNILQAAALKYGSKFPGFGSVLGMQATDFPHFESLLAKMRTCIETQGSLVQRLHATETLKIMNRNDISDTEKVNLCLALAGKGQVGDAVLDRDHDRIESDHELDLVATRIVPWEACSDAERLDPDNYILMDSQLAEQFAAGLVSYRNTGNPFHDSAMDEDIFDPWIDPYFQLPALNTKQKKYMAYHRKYVYKQWRTYAPKPMYLASQ